jgi:dihydrofolate reductase
MICAIFTIDQVGGMGLKGSMPWPHHPEDMAWFRELTEGHVVIMGRKTWDDPKMPKPMPKRINYVVTNRPIGVRGVHTLSGNWLQRIPEIEQLHLGKKIFIIGGPELIEAAKPITDFAYVSYRRGNFRCDARINMSDYVVMMRTISSRPSADKMLNFCIFRHIESDIPLYEGLS